MMRDIYSVGDAVLVRVQNAGGIVDVAATVIKVSEQHVYVEMRNFWTGKLSRLRIRPESIIEHVACAV